MATDSATSPLARYATTLEAVPPGTEPSMSRPMASIGLSPSIFDTATAANGMMTNCAITPMAMGHGRRATSLRSGIVSVRPMQNMITIRA